MVETKEDKAHRILAEGRLTVERVKGAVVVASCKGFSDGEVYRLGFDPRSPGGGEWRCTCDASAKFHRRCSHLIALQLVTVKPTATATDQTDDEGER